MHFWQDSPTPCSVNLIGCHWLSVRKNFEIIQEVMQVEVTLTANWHHFNFTATLQLRLHWGRKTTQVTITPKVCIRPWSQTMHQCNHFLIFLFLIQYKKRKESNLFAVLSSKLSKADAKNEHFNRIRLYPEKQSLTYCTWNCKDFSKQIVVKIVAHT